MARGAVDVNHRRGVLVRREGQRSFPVERILGGDRLIERRRSGGRIVALLAPEPQSVADLQRPAFDQPGPTGQPGDTGVDQDAIDVDAAEAGSEAVVADHHHRRTSLLRQLAEPPDRLIQTADHLGRGVVPFGAVDAGLVDVQIGPDAVLERVQVLKLDHQHRPVGDDSVGEPASLGTAAEALGGQPGVVRELFERLRRPLPEVAQAVAGCLGLAPGGETRGRRERGFEMGRIHARDDNSAHLERGIQPGHIEADDRPAGDRRAIARASARGSGRSG